MTEDDRKALLCEMQAAYDQATNSDTERRAKMNAVLQAVEARYSVVKIRAK